jgi:hypothetical protein
MADTILKLADILLKKNRNALSVLGGKLISFSKKWQKAISQDINSRGGHVR